MLCEHNPHRRCSVNFAPKYLVNDLLKAKCEAPIRVEVIDRSTGVPLGEDISDVHLEVTHSHPTNYTTEMSAFNMNACVTIHSQCTYSLASSTQAWGIPEFRQSLLGNASALHLHRDIYHTESHNCHVAYGS